MANHDSYCMLLATKHAFSQKNDIVADFGHFSAPADIAEDLKNMISEIDALNYLAAKDWELVSSYTNQLMNETRHIMRKKA